MTKSNKKEEEQEEPDLSQQGSTLVSLSAKIRRLPDPAFLWLCSEVAFEHGARFPDRYSAEPPPRPRRPSFFRWYEA